MLDQLTKSFVRGFSSSAKKEDVASVNTQSSFLTLKQPTEWQERWFLSSNAKYNVPISLALDDSYHLMLRILEHYT